ncbi:MAG: helix-turn-helix domain-containing protein [Candidatus Berkelbacteria bacterium]
MQLDTLKNAGLTPGEIKIYEVLLDNGGQTAGNIISLTKLKRGDCYNKLYDLIDRGLVLESTKNKKKYFELSSPDAIEAYIERRIENLATTQKEIKSILPNILSTYNLSYHKPGVKFFEGEEGMEKIMSDSLTAATTIDEYVDIEAVEKYISKINRAHAKKRQSSNIKKRLLVADTVFNRKFFTQIGDKATEVRYLKADIDSFSTAMLIYDNKISYLTLKPDSMMGIIIEDELIARMHKKLFEFNWSIAKAD